MLKLYNCDSYCYIVIVINCDCQNQTKKQGGMFKPERMFTKTYNWEYSLIVITNFN